MLEKIKDTILKYSMLDEGERVVCALSGGADSIAMTVALKELGYQVCAAHVNHSLRGEESDRDEKFCAEFCQSQGITLYTEHIDVKHYCEEQHLSIELGARELRYQALESMAQGVKIATAHTLSDALETSIFNLTRGGGLHGLSSIPPIRGGYIRPLIGCTRAEVEEYLRRKGISFVTDSTNLSTDYSRNKIRLEVVPVLKTINPSLEKTFSGTVESLREADKYIDTRARELLNAVRRGDEFDFSSCEPDAVMSRAVSMLLKEQEVEPSYDKITAVKSLITSGGVINLKKGVYLASHGGRLSFETDICDPEIVTSELTGCVEWSGKRIVLTKISHFDISCFNKGELRYIFDKDRLSGRYTFRSYLGNETIRLPERGFSSTVKKLLSDVKPSMRKTKLVISDKIGAVFVEGVGVSERVSCGDNTTAAVKIEIYDIKENNKCPTNETFE